MSKCDLRIELDRPNRSYRVGETVRGKVHVSVNDACDCNALTLAREWRTHGRGNRASGGKHEQVLFLGRLNPGQEASHAFEFPVPAGPLTYRGRLLNVDWYVKARADIPWAIDPKAEEDFIVESGEGGGPISLGPEHRPAQRVDTSQSWGATLLGSAFFVLGLGIGLVGLRSESWTAGIIGLVIAVAGIRTSFATLRNSLARRKLGVVDVEIDRRRFSPGEAIGCAVSFQAPGAVAVERITASLIAKEIVVSGSGTNETTHEHVVHDTRVELSGPKAIRPGERVSFDQGLALATDAPFTFAADDNELSWYVELHVSIENWPDWKRDVPITVAPRP